MGDEVRDRSRLPRGVAIVATCTLVVGSAGIPAAVAAFVDNDAQAAAEFTGAPDWIAPQVGSTVIAKTTGYLAGSTRQGGTYYVYANVADSGSPASGVATAAADVTALTPGGTAVALAPGSYSVGGLAFTHRSAAQTAVTPLAQGSHTYSITSTDGAGNNRTQAGYGVTVDNTAPTASNVQTTNKAGGTSGRAEAGDTIALTYSEQIDPHSILAGWTGSSTAVVVRLVDGGCVLNLLVTVCSDDSVRVHTAANTSQLPLGTVDLNRGDYHGTVVGTASPLTFGASGTPSTMVQSGGTITITLGTGSATAATAGGTAAMVWSPAITAYDAAGNGASATAVTESGTSDREF